MDEIPHPAARFFRTLQRARFPGNELQIGNDIGAGGAGLQMLLLLGAPIVIYDLRQTLLQLRTGHTSSLPDTAILASHGLVAFSALLVLRSSRSFILALCHCDLLVPIDPPTTSTISLC